MGEFLNLVKAGVTAGSATELVSRWTHRQLHPVIDSTTTWDEVILNRSVCCFLPYPARCSSEVAD